MANLQSSKLTLTKIQNGQDGQDGQPGSAGANGYNAATIYLYQRVASEPSAPSGTLTYNFTTGALSPSSALGNWSQTMPNNNSNPCWVAIAAAISNISTDTIESNDWIIRELVENGANGSPGVSITGVVEEYAINDSSTTAPTTGWSTSQIAPTSSNKYLWNREVISYSSGNSTTTTPHIAGMYSEDGADGKGISSIVNTYAINNDGTTAPATGWEETPMAPTSSNKYLWNKEVVNYTTGNPTTTTRVIGTFSEDGYNQATIYLYQRTTATSVSAPTGYSYTFSTNTISPTLTTWSRSIPSGTDPCWVTSAVVVSRTDSNNQLNFVTPTLMVKNGANGANGASYATVYLYKRGSSAPAKPNGNVIYTFSTGAVTGSLNSWTKQIPTGTDPCWMIVAQATASAGETQDTISSSEWSTQTKIVENGADGAPGADGVTITGTAVDYVVSDNGNTPPGPSANWSSSIPSSIPDQSYLWTRTTVSYSDSTPDTVSYSVSYKAKNGNNGTSVTITSKSIQYKVLSTGTGDPGSTGWSDNIPSANPGQYLWTRTIVNYSDGNSTTAYSVSKMGINGTNGTDGADGYNTATVFLYKRGVPTSPATNLSGPTGTLTYTFTTGQLTASNSSYFNGWSQSIPAVNNDKEPCWVTTAAAISQDSSINISTNQWSQSVKLVEDGQDGEDANQYQIHLNYQSLIKFTELNGNTLYIDSPLEITAWDTKNNQQLIFTSSNPTITIKIDNYNLSDLFKATFLNTFLTRDNNKYILNLQTLYNSYSTWGSTAPSNVFNNNTQYSVYKQYFDNLFSDINGLSVGQIQIVLNSTSPSYRIERFIDLKSGIPDDLMKFTVSARSINAAVDSTKLLFNNEGLTITNGKFIIQNEDENHVQNELLSYKDNKLTVVGDVYADNGYFKGTIEATNSTFSGTITANGGTIGGFNIGSDTISNGSLTLKADGDNSSISVKNINIGTGANITDFLQIGNLKLLNPNTNNNYVMKLDDGSVKFSLDNNGSLVATNANISGVINASSGTFSGDIVAATISASTIKTLNFITNNVRSMGGSYIFKPTYEIINTTINGQNIIVTLNDANQFKSGDIVGLTTTSGIIYGSVYSKSNNDVTVSTAITGLNDTKFSTITWFGIPYNSNNQDSDVIIGINSDDSTSSILPKQSLIISDFTYNNTNSTLSSTIKLLLGKLSSAKDASGNELSGYGLYADNVYLHGSLVTETASTDSTTYAGVNTIPEVIDNIFSERIVFWAGATVANGAENSPFYVTENGSIYASRGRFTGSVIAESIISNSTIETAVIKGTGNSPSLKIYNTDDDNNYGISFYRDEYEINNTTYPEQETLRITNKGIIHYYKNNSIINNTSIISFSEDSENVNIKASSYQNGNTNYLNGLINYNNKSILTFDNNIKLAYDNNQYLNIASDNIELKNQTIISRGNVTFTNVYSNTDKKLDYKINDNGYYCLYVS